jgi:3-dehydroquinate synthase
MCLSKQCASYRSNFIARISMSEQANRNLSMARRDDTQTIEVRIGSSFCPVVCGVGASRHLRKHIVKHVGTRPLFVTSSQQVWNSCGLKIQHALNGADISRVILFDDREAAKSLPTAEALCRELIRAGAHRDATLIAVGGGVVGDVAGFAAAIFLRGISIVHVPTTLLAQVDSSIGGKTGVNLPEGKNLVGAFHHPQLVVCDPALLASLTERQFRAGLFEVVKCAAIADKRLFELLEAELPGASRHNVLALMQIIPRCIAIKAAIVADDERDRDGRALLNFGHTVGHALEAATKYRRFLHGEAIGWGMLAAGLTAVALDKLGSVDAARLMRLIVQTGPLPALPKILASRMWSFVQRDKKSREGVVRWVLPVAIGSAKCGIAVPQGIFSKVWAELPRWEEQCRKLESHR